MSIYSKIAQARVQFLHANVKQTGQNKYAGYDYFELGDIISVALPICEELGLCPIITFDSEYATMTVVDCDDNSTVEFKSPMATATLKGCHEIQNMGAVETYQRRYLWYMFLEVIEHDALDSTQGKPDSATQQNTTKVPRQPKTNQNDAKVVGEPDYSASSVWSAIMLHFGYRTDNPHCPESSNARAMSLQFIKDYGCESGKDITPEKGKAIMDRITRIEQQNNNGEEIIAS